jgi:hypothetical protein
MKSTVRRIFLLPLACGFLLTNSAFSQTEVNRRIEASATAEVIIENLAGSVVVTGWDKEMVEVHGTLGRGIKELEVESGGDRIEIEVEPLRGSRRDGGAQLEVRVPRGSMVEVQTVSADITISGVEGELELSAVSGNIEVEGAREDLSVETVSGKIKVKSAGGRVSAESVSGQVVVGGVSGRVDISSVSGHVKLSGEQLTQGTVEVVSGQAELSGSLAPGGEIEMSSHSGRLVLRLPASTSARISVESYSGSIDNELGPPAQRVGRFGPQSELDFKMGGGDGRVEIETFSGHVSLEKQ